jgi:hypothetical protein
MTAKRFPTPSLDAVAAITTIPAMLHMEMLRAIQADIALSVEAARTVPVETEIALTITIGLNMYQAACSRDSEEIRAARKWLESLTVAPKEVPPEDKRCGTCANYGVTTSECLLPMTGDKLIEVSPEFGRKCECWKAKP